MPEPELTQALLSSLFQGDGPAPNFDVRFTGASAYGAVSDLALASVTVAATALQRFCHDIHGFAPPASVDAARVDIWCASSFVPDGWSLPPLWDAFSGDYRCQDGWVRLHCNAPHHREAALRVLGDVTSRTEAERAALGRRATELSEAVVAAGGCAAELRTSHGWRQHPQGQAVAREPIIAWGRIVAAPGAWMPGPLDRPLAGLKVLDLTRIIAGPVSTRFLASLGADVLRVDPPGWREGGTEIEMTLGKTCAALDLSDESDRALFRQLVRDAHLLVHGYRKDALTRLGFGSEALAALNPALPTVGLTAYGWTGPWSHRRGFDSLVQRSTGLAVAEGGRTVDLPYQVLDHATGYLMAASAIEALRRQITGHTVASARLSLARQAMILLDRGADATKLPDGRLEDHADLARTRGQREVTSWGAGWRCPNPISFEKLPLFWNRPAHHLGSDGPTWTA